MDKEIQNKLDSAIESAVKEVKNEQEQTKRSMVFAPPQIIRKSDGKFSYARLIKAMATGRWAEAPFEKEAIEKAYPTPGISSVLGDTYGGYLVPTEYSAELIDLLTAEAVVRRAGASVYPMTRDTLNIPTMTAGATTYWGAEAGDKTMDTATRFGQCQLVAKKLYCLVGISNELIADSSPAVEVLVRRDIVRELGLAEDLGYLMTQTSGPTGFLHTHANGYAEVTNSARISTNYLYAGGNATTAVAGGGTITYDDILDAMYKVEAQNARVTGWIMHPRTKNSLRKIQDANGQYIYAIHPEAKVPETLYGLPVYLTTQVGITFDDGTNSAVANLSYVICGDFTDAVIGQRQGIELAVSEHVGFQTDSTWIRATLRVDFQVKHEKAFCAILDVAS